MSIRKISFAIDEYYHIYNRGNSKQVIFKNEEDYNRFLSLLYVINNEQKLNFTDIKKSKKDLFSIEFSDKLVSIGAYVLMPNHFHLLVREKTEGGISKFMQKLSTAYSMYFNKKYNRAGSLFEGKFKSEYVDNDKYLKYLFSYIHLNPVKLIQKDWKEKGIKSTLRSFEFLEKYKNSSFHDYYHNDDRKEKIILDKNNFPKYFSFKNSFKEELLEWLNSGGKASGTQNS